jgi:hypothetical protein
MQSTRGCSKDTCLYFCAPTAFVSKRLQQLLNLDRHCAPILAIQTCFSYVQSKRAFIFKPLITLS